MDAYAPGMPWMSPYSAMANNPVMFLDPDGNEPISIIIGVTALVGGGLNLWSNASKVKDFKTGAAYFLAGAAGGVISLASPLAGGALTSTANIGIDIATGNLPNFNDPWEVGKYAGFNLLDGVSAGQAGKLGRVLPVVANLHGILHITEVIPNTLV